LFAANWPARPVDPETNKTPRTKTMAATREPAISLFASRFRASDRPATYVRDCRIPPAIDAAHRFIGLARGPRVRSRPAARHTFTATRPAQIWRRCGPRSAMGFRHEEFSTPFHACGLVQTSEFPLALLIGFPGSPLAAITTRQRPAHCAKRPNRMLSKHPVAAPRRSMRRGDPNFSAAAQAPPASRDPPSRQIIIRSAGFAVL